MGKTRSRRIRRITKVNVQKKDLGISKEYIEALRDYGVSDETIRAAERRNAQLAREQTAAAS